jgi:guanylate kinase
MLVVISGPSGVGKTTITRALVERLNAVLSVSMTTRPRAATDRDGIDYYFVDQAAFDRAVAEGQLLEWARVFDNCYGTPRVPVEEHLSAGRDVLLEIDVKGAVQIKQAFPEAVTVFILPPSEEVLLERLRRRGRESEEVIQKRYAQARREIAAARESRAYDHFVVNERLEQAIDEAYTSIASRRQKS